MTIVPHTIYEKFGKHSLVLTYQPDADEDQRWQWELRIQKTFTYEGRSPSVAECKATALIYVNAYDGARI